MFALYRYLATTKSSRRRWQELLVHGPRCNGDGHQGAPVPRVRRAQRSFVRHQAGLCARADPSRQNVRARLQPGRVEDPSQQYRVHAVCDLHCRARNGAIKMLVRPWQVDWSEQSKLNGNCGSLLGFLSNSRAGHVENAFTLSEENFIYLRIAVALI